MSWTEIVIEIARDNAEAMSDALMEAGALSVSVEDADEGTDAEQPLFGEPGMEPKEAAWERSRVVALTDVDADQAAIVATAAAAVGMATVPAFTMRPVEEQDWVRLTQSQFAPIHIGKNIWVVPSWHEAPDPDGLILELDPGLAFGTGSHPTTRLCMEWLEANPAPGKTVLDYGCGSGILAIAAARLGAGRVAGVDIDPQAVDAARANAERNGLSNTEFHVGKAEVVVPELYAQGYRADVVMVDPPRKGCERVVLDTILQMAPRTLVYVSCDPNSLARDLAYLLPRGYRLDAVQPVDMFPHTLHVETVVRLRRI